MDLPRVLVDVTDLSSVIIQQAHVDHELADLRLPALHRVPRRVPSKIFQKAVEIDASLMGVQTRDQKDQESNDEPQPKVHVGGIWRPLWGGGGAHFLPRALPLPPSLRSESFFGLRRQPSLQLTTDDEPSSTRTVVVDSWW